MKFILNFQIFLNLHARFFLLPELVSTSEKIYIYIYDSNTYSLYCIPVLSRRFYIFVENVLF